MNKKRNKTGKRLDGVAIASDALKGAVIEEKDMTIARLREDNDALTEANECLRDVVTLQQQRIKGEVATCEFNKRCLESAESALHEKDAKIVELCRTVAVLRKENKKLKKELREKRRVIVTLNKEIEFQYKRRDKAECYLNAVGKAVGVIKERIEGYGRDKKS